MVSSNHRLERSDRQSKGFTLIELLVVIAIISLLVSILLPSLNQAKELAKEVVCMSLHKQLGLGVAFYMNDYNEVYPAAYMSGGGYFTHISLLRPYDLDPRSGVYLCPAADPYLDYTKELADIGKPLGSGWTYDYIEIGRASCRERV